MKTVRYPAEFKAEAVKQVTERGHGVDDVAKRLGMSDKSLYLWVRLAQEHRGGKLMLPRIRIRRRDYINLVFLSTTPPRKVAGPKP